MAGVHKVFELLNGFRKSKVLFVATKLKIFDELNSVGPSTSSFLANKLSLNEPALNTLLHSCVALELLNKDTQQNKFSVGDLAKKYLITESPDSLSGSLESSLKSGATCWKDSKILNSDSSEEEIAKSSFSQLYKTEEDLNRFLSGMHGLSVSCAASLVEQFDLSQFKTLVDLGGGSGALVCAACRQYPSLRTSIFDLPSTLPFSQASLLRQCASTSPLLLQRISLIPGNFFDDPLPDADLFSLSRIIHDWDEERAVLLLKKVYEKLQEGGGVLICEMVLDEDGCGPIETLLQSLNMLVQTGGKERKFSEYKRMLESVGFKQVQFKRTGQYLDAILAIK